MKTIFFTLFLSLLAVYTFSQNALPAATTASSGKLTVNFSMNNAGGSYGSSEVIAVYITNSANQLINTLFYRTNNSNSSGGYLTTWWSLIGSSWPSVATRATVTKTLTDASTGATTSSYLLNQVAYWGNNAAAATAVTAVPDGTYKVNFEVSNGTRRYYSGTFVKGPANSNSTVTASIGFANISIAWVPATATALNDIELEKMYSVYPNPATSSIFVTGSDIKQVEICSLTGKVILTSKEQTVNISGLPKGVYLAVVKAKTGTIVKKLVKQ